MTMMTRWIALVFVAALGVATMAPLDMARADEPTAEAVAKGGELAGILNTADAFESVVRALRSDIVRLAAASNPDKTTEINAAADEAAAEIRAQGETLRSEIARIYAMNYSVEELDELIAFFSSPIGSKFLEQRQVVERGVLEATVVWGDIMSERIVTLVREKLAAQGINF